MTTVYKLVYNSDGQPPFVAPLEIEDTRTLTPHSVKPDCYTTAETTAHGRHIVCLTEEIAWSVRTEEALQWHLETRRELSQAMDALEDARKTEQTNFEFLERIRYSSAHARLAKAQLARKNELKK